MKVICFCHQLNCFGFENCKQSEAQLFTRCSLLVEVHSLLVTRSKITRYLLQNPLVTCCRSYSLQEFTPYLFHKLLVAKTHSLLVVKFSRYLLQKKLLIVKNHSLVVAKFACYSLQQITCYSMKNIIHHLLKQS